MSSTILYSLNEGVARIALNRPKVYNCFNREMAFALIDALENCANNPEVRVIVLTAEGHKAFCAGQDLNEAMNDNGITFEMILTEHYNPIIQKIRALKKPIICAVNGVAAGAGANIAFACDLTIAKASTNFTQAFSKIGLVPDSGGSFFLPRLVGMQKAAALTMLSEKISAEEAERLGLIYKVVLDESFEAEVSALARRLAQMPTKALAMTKELLNATWGNTLTQQLEMEGEYQIEASESYDYNEGVQAFIEKRKPVFKGK